MKNLMERCNKKYDKPIIAGKIYKKEYDKMKLCLTEYGIPMEKKDDPSYFWLEIMYYSIQVKLRFEEVFLDTYVKMFDYWYDLTYLERKKQMNIDIDRLREQLPSFKAGEQDIYMPCFDKRFNNLYATEIVLLDLKQYHAFIRTFDKEIYEHLYGVDAFLYGCNSAEVVAQGEESFVLYHRGVNRLYVYRHDTYTHCLSFDPKQVPEEDSIIKQIAAYLLQEQEDEIIALLQDSELISKKMKQKLQKYQKKKQGKKKQEKE